MVHERPEKDRYGLTIAMDAELAERIEEIAENQPEITESRLCREGIRLALERYE